MARDKYDEEIEYLSERPDMIETHWCNPYCRTANGLFGYLDGRGGTCGCLTLVRQEPDLYAGGHRHLAPLIREIAADTRIPTTPDRITVEDLPVFAEWQRRLDKELGR